MKTYSINVGETVAMKYVATIESPTNPSADNYRYDLSYSSTATGICEVQFFDKDRNDWAALSGTPVDMFLLRMVEDEPLFKGQQFIYFTMVTETEMPENNVIDVTPVIPKLN